jgi:hypothetical protein
MATTDPSRKLHRRAKLPCMAEGELSQAQGWTRDKTRVACAIGAAFLIPGLALWVGWLLLSDQSVPGVRPLTLSDWMLSAAGFSVGIALWGSPIIIADLAIWRLLYRHRTAKPAAFALIGLVSSWPPLLLWWPKLPPAAVLASFCGAGVLTGLAVWSIAYLGVPAGD